MPRFRYRLTLQPNDGRYNERQVRLKYQPALHDDQSPCLAAGMEYLFTSALYDIDHSPLIDYGYHDSHGKPLGPEQRRALHRPVCRCDLSRAERDSVERE